MGASSTTQGGLLRAEEVGRQLGITTPYVYYLAKRGVIPSVKLSRAVRFEPEAIQQFILNHRRSAVKA